ncbi:C39 family peptidase [Chitinimonas sp. BJYL2]|uniref:C39 family peptidase n=1 Tax=Chitinimonas sp. BJYL2 TaxID=2976696 RepID=UPI0022B3071B|nr:C39 family peptidase [Chitinimonas sp. BJYL2]
MYLIKRLIQGGALMAMSLSAHALCPDGSTYDSTLTTCVTSVDAFGPFTNQMVAGCQSAGGGSACTKTYPYLVKGHTVNVMRWSKSFAANLRGTGSCPVGSVRSATYGNHCFEQNSGSTNNVYGNFSLEEVAKCESLGGGSACYTNRWSATFYLQVQGAATPPPSNVTNKYGVWLFYADALGKTHTQLADQLKAQGVKRIYIKIADGTNACSLFPDACSKATTDIYRSRGIEPWAWAYNYPGNNAAQADALYQAAKYGYVGFVTDIEVEFDRKTTELSSLLQAMQAARTRAKTDGYVPGGVFPLGATTWGNPTDHGMRVDIIDQYVDFHMPQTYVEVWGSTYMADPKRWIEAGNCEYRNLGATKPIWHIVSTEYDTITSAQLEAFMTAAGPNASIWRIPGGGTPTTIWNDWAGINWQRSSFSEAQCGSGNNLLTDYLGSTPAPVPTQTIPYWSQLANAYEPYATCSVTSMAMITDFFKLTDPAKLGKRTPDYLYERFGKRQTVSSLAQVFNTIAAEKGSSLRDTGLTNGTLAQLRERASQGKPTIVHGWFTAPGHILVVTGYDGTNYTVNDPYGKWNLVAGSGAAYDTSVSGKGLKYPKAAFERAINDNGLGNDLWLHLFD